MHLGETVPDIYYEKADTLRFEMGEINWRSRDARGFPDSEIFTLHIRSDIDEY